ncbi:hypothetical protein RND81_10G107200 [Saponaria officinalis]|uniref:Uncharacterized protein n=1 Tax=Saponaria officinalis TaxID=3572 RepID=A0AAW1I1E9_SAPOF
MGSRLPSSASCLLKICGNKRNKSCQISGRNKILGGQDTGNRRSYNDVLHSRGKLCCHETDHHFHGLLFVCRQGAYEGRSGHAATKPLKGYTGTLIGLGRVLFALIVACLEFAYTSVSGKKRVGCVD